MSHIRWAALCAVTTSLLVPVSVCAEPVSLWTLNGSTIGLSTDGPSLAFRYQKPRKGLRDEGVKTGTLLFSGSRSGATISGTGYVFSRRCGAIPYPVSGVAVDAGNIRLYGSSPTALDANCRPLKYQHDVNAFTRLAQIAAPPQPVRSGEAGDSVDAPEQNSQQELRTEPERLAEARRLEEQRLAQLRAFTAEREACRSYDVAACDAALRSPHASVEDTAALKTWRDTAIALATAVQQCQAGSFPSCDAALASPALPADSRTRVLAWRQEASPLAKVKAYLEQQYAAITAIVANATENITYRPPSMDGVAARAAALALPLAALLITMSLIAITVRHRHVVTTAGARLRARLAQLRSRLPEARAVLTQITGAAGKIWSWFIGPLTAPTPALAPEAPKPAKALARVKERDTPAAIAALELALAYLEEVRQAECPAYDDEMTRKHHLNTLSLAAKQLERAEKLDPDAMFEAEDKDGAPLRFSVSEMKAEALFLEGVTHQTYDIKRAIPPLVKATALNPNDPRPFYVLGLTHAANHNKKQAVAALQRAVALDPKNLTYRKELNRVENMTAGEIAAYKTTRAGERVFDAGVGVANAGIRVWNVGVILWNIFAFTYNVLTWPLRIVLRIAG